MFLSEPAPIGNAPLARSTTSRQENCKDATFRFLVMERAREDIEEFFIRQYHVSTSADAVLAAVFDFGIEAALLLESLHQMGLVHGDVHGGNFVKMTDGRLALIDFGDTQYFNEGISRSPKKQSLNFDLLSP